MDALSTCYNGAQDIESSAPMPESIKEESKPKPKSLRGGKRAGAGRKPNYFKKLGIKAVTAADILAHHNELELWTWLLKRARPALRLQALQYLTDRRDGKPKQAVEVGEQIQHALTVYRNPVLAGLSAEELASLDALSRKLALPEPKPPQIQEESTPSGMQNRIPSGHTPSGSEGLFERIGADHEARPSSLASKSNDKQHVVAIDKRL